MFLATASVVSMLVPSASGLLLAALDGRCWGKTAASPEHADTCEQEQPDNGTGHAELMHNGPGHEATELVITRCRVNMLIRVIDLLELRQEHHAEIGL